MGMLEQLQAGYSFDRLTTTISASAGVVSGSLTTLGASYILLNIAATTASRVRLYTDSASMALDLPRAVGSTAVSDLVGLTIDANITNDELSLGIDPPLIGTTFSGSTAYYLISSSGTSIQLQSYPIEKITTYRQSLRITGSAMISGTDGATGNITSPKSFLILSASATTQSRLRLYSIPIGEIATSEISRPFGTPASSSAHLISDLMFDSASIEYKLVPILQAFNLQQYLTGQNTVGYVFQNQSNAASVNATASLHIYSIED